MARKKKATQVSGAGKSGGKKAGGKAKRKATGKDAKKASAKNTRKKSTGKPEGDAAPQKRAGKKAKTPTKQPTGGSLTPEARYRLIAEAAYLIAEARGFQDGDPTRDWLQAEAEVDERLGTTNR